MRNTCLYCNKEHAKLGARLSYVVAKEPPHELFGYVCADCAFAMKVDVVYGDRMNCITTNVNIDVNGGFCPRDLMLVSPFCKLCKAAMYIQRMPHANAVDAQFWTGPLCSTCTFRHENGEAIDAAAKLAAREAATINAEASRALRETIAAQSRAQDFALGEIGDAIRKLAPPPPQPAPARKSLMSPETLRNLRFDADAGAWRTARKQLLKLIREPLCAKLAAMFAPGDPAALARIGRFLDTELGDAMLSAVVGAALSSLPSSVAGSQMGQIAGKLAVECRQHAIGEAGDALADVLMGPLRAVAVQWLTAPEGAAAVGMLGEPARPLEVDPARAGSFVPADGSGGSA